MNYLILPILILMGMLLEFKSSIANPSNAEQPASAASQTVEMDFVQPPVPKFMLQSPEKPLTLEQMEQQAHEAALKAQSKATVPNPVLTPQTIPNQRNHQSN